MSNNQKQAPTKKHRPTFDVVKDHVKKLSTEQRIELGKMINATILNDRQVLKKQLEFIDQTFDIVSPTDKEK
jgi:hypothetical protein